MNTNQGNVIAVTADTWTRKKYSDHKELENMRSTGWLSLTIALLVITVMLVFYTGYEVFGALGTGVMMVTVWQTFTMVERENSQR
jgi:Na+/H+ antiporter NhaC